MLSYLTKNVNKIAVILSILLACTLIFSYISGLLPLNFLFFSSFALLTFFFALYYPKWIFGLFIASLPLEIINLAPEFLGVMVRPYQFFGGILFLVFAISLLQGKSKFKPTKFDWLVLAFGLSGFMGYLGATNSGGALKQAIILLSFAGLYFVSRFFIQNFGDIKKYIPFLMGFSVIVVLYGIWQNILFKLGLKNFEVMPGRPNATFAEADWLGIYLVFFLAISYSLSSNFEFLILNFKSSSNDKTPDESKQGIRKSILVIAYGLLLTASYVLLILTVARSAWLGAVAVTFAFLLFSIIDKQEKIWKLRWKNFLFSGAGIFFAFILSAVIVMNFKLTSFELFNRTQSVTSGLQEITISCQEDIDIPNKIDNISQLADYNCRHINIEEINLEESKGNLVARIFRPDPNVEIRANIYKESFQQIKENPILGIGWGNISNVLGKDERGAGLNSSNIFLEIWLGSGIVGIVAFLSILFLLLRRSFNLIFSKIEESRTLGIFLFLGLIAITIPNLFNAGLMLGFFWMFLAISQVKIKTASK